MTKCINCSKNKEIYESQFPTTWYATKKCEVCGKLFSIIFEKKDD